MVVRKLLWLLNGMILKSSFSGNVTSTCSCQDGASQDGVYGCQGVAMIVLRYSELFKVGVAQA